MFFIKKNPGSQGGQEAKKRNRNGIHNETVNAPNFGRYHIATKICDPRMGSGFFSREKNHFSGIKNCVRAISIAIKKFTHLRMTERARWIISR